MIPIYVVAVAAAAVVALTVAAVVIYGCRSYSLVTLLSTGLLMLLFNTFFALPMRLFHPLNSLVVTRNLWLILVSKI